MSSNGESSKAKNPGASAHSSAAQSPSFPLSSATPSARHRQATQRRPWAPDGPNGCKDSTGRAPPCLNTPRSATHTPKRHEYPKPLSPPPPRSFVDLTGETTSDPDSSSESGKRKQKDTSSFATPSSKRCRTDSGPTPSSRINVSTEKQPAHRTDTPAWYKQPPNGRSSCKCDEAIVQADKAIICVKKDVARLADAQSTMIEGVADLGTELQEKATLGQVRESVDVSELIDRDDVITRVGKCEKAVQDVLSEQRDIDHQYTKQTKALTDRITKAEAVAKQDMEDFKSTQEASREGLKDYFEKKLNDEVEDVRISIGEVKDKSQKANSQLRQDFDRKHSALETSLTTYQTTVHQNSEKQSLELNHEISKVQQSCDQTNSQTRKELKDELSKRDISSTTYRTTVDETLGKHTNQIGALETRVSKTESLPDREALQAMLDEQSSRHQLNMESAVSGEVRRVDQVVSNLQKDTSGEIKATHNPISRRINKVDTELCDIKERVTTLESMRMKTPTGPRESNAVQEVLESPKFRNYIGELNSGVDSLSTKCRDNFSQDWKEIKKATGRIQALEDKNSEQQKELENRDRQVSDQERQIKDCNATIKRLQDDMLTMKLGYDRKFEDFSAQFIALKPTSPQTTHQVEGASASLARLDWNVEAINRHPRSIEQRTESPSANIAKFQNGNSASNIDDMEFREWGVKIFKPFKADTTLRVEKLGSKVDGSDGKIGIIGEIKDLKGRMHTMTELSGTEMEAFREDINFLKAEGVKHVQEIDILKTQRADVVEAIGKIIQAVNAMMTRLNGLETKVKETGQLGGEVDALTGRLLILETSVDQLVTDINHIKTEQLEIRSKVQKVEQLATDINDLKTEQVDIGTRVEKVGTDVDALKTRSRGLESRVEEVGQLTEKTITVAEPSQALGRAVWNQLNDEYFAQVSGNEKLDAFLGKIRFAVEDIITNYGTLKRDVNLLDQKQSQGNAEVRAILEACSRADNDIVIDSIPIAAIKAIKAYVDEHVQKHTDGRIADGVNTVAEGMEQFDQRITFNTHNIQGLGQDIKQLQDAFSKLPRVLTVPSSFAINEWVRTLYLQSINPTHTPTSRPQPPHLQNAQTMPRQAMHHAPNTPPGTPLDAHSPQSLVPYTGAPRQPRPTPEMIANSITLQQRHASIAVPMNNMTQQFRGFVPGHPAPGHVYPQHYSQQAGAPIMLPSIPPSGVQPSNVQRRWSAQDPIPDPRFPGA